MKFVCLKMYEGRKWVEINPLESGFIVQSPSPVEFPRPLNLSPPTLPLAVFLDTIDHYRKYHNIP